MYNKNLRVHLIDTPGFDDTNRSDVQVLQDVAHWLSKSFENGIRLSGLIFIHRISDPRLSGSARRNLLMFKKLCGEKVYQSVVLATSMWSKITPDEGIAREKELVETKDWWGHMYEKGSRVFRLANTKESCIQVVGYILSLHMTITLDIQDEIINQHRDIDETSAAHELNAEILRERKMHKAELETMRAQMEDAIAEHDEELQSMFKEQIEGLQEKLQKGDEEQKKLQQTLEEVDKRKEAEFKAFKEQMRREREEERVRFERERQDLQKNFAKHEEELKKRQMADIKRMEQQHLETKRAQEEYRREARERQVQQQRRMEEIERRHAEDVAEREEQLRRRNDSKFAPVT
jgi:hypothetical protein